jgi:Tol biopolymer transport system component
MSPEQVRGQAADERADLFALGAILYEMLAGKRAFRKPTSAETMSAVLNEEPPAISQIVPGIPPALQRVVQRCLEKGPQQRFHSASDLAFALEALSGTDTAPTSAFAVTKFRASAVWIAFAGILIALAVGVTVWLMRQSATPVVEAVTQLTDDGELKTGSLETDGARIYVNEGLSGSLRIAQVSVSGGETVSLTTQLVNPQIAGLAKDGSALLVLEGGPFVGGPESMWLVSLPAGTARRLGEIEVTAANLLLDGRVVYTLGSAVYIAEKDGSRPHKVAEVLQSHTDTPQVSPDGKRIFFSAIDNLSGEHASVYEVATDGTGLRELLKGGEENLPADACCARWSPDGKYVLFQARSQANWDLWVIPAGGDIGRSPAPMRLTNGPLSYTSGTFSRDGKQIFSLGTKPRGQLVRYDAKAGQFLPYLGGISAYDTTFSRDGKWVSYVSYPEHSLWRSRADGSDRLQLTYPPQVAVEPRISPDGTRVAFNTPTGVGGDAYVIGMNGGTAQKIADNANAPDWSPDGNLVAVGSLIPGKTFGEKGYSQSRIVDLRSRTVSAVPDSQATVGPWFVTQNTLVAGTEDQTKFLLFDLNTKKWSDLAANPTTPFLAWEPSPDGKYLYCTTQGSDPKVLRIRIADHSVETIASLKDLHEVNDPYDVTEVGVAPDGSPLFTRDVGTQEIYALQVKWP